MPRGRGVHVTAPAAANLLVSDENGVILKQGFFSKIKRAKPEKRGSSQQEGDDWTLGKRFSPETQNKSKHPKM